MRYLFTSVLVLFIHFCSFAVLGPISGPSTVCGSGATITLTNGTPGGVWTSSATSVATVGAGSGIVTGGAITAAGTTTITYTVGAEAVYATVSVNPTPTIFGATVFCTPLMTDTFTASLSGGMWTCDSVSLDSMAPTGILYRIFYAPGPVLMTDTVRYIMPTGCMAKTYVHVHPMMGVSAPASVCAGGTSVATTYIPGYWSSGTPAIGTISSSGMFSGISDGSASLTFTAISTLSPAICVMAGYSTNVWTGISTYHINSSPSAPCVGPELVLNTCGSPAAYSVTTTFGDGTADTSAVGSTGTHSVFHPYSFPGTYTIQQKLFDGGTLIDSVTQYYTYNYCHTLPVKMYSDNNGNCNFDFGETFSFLPCKVQVDSAGVPIDTIPATSGLYYKAYGPPGTVYGFRIIDISGGMSVSCPSSGIIYDTISSAVTIYADKYFGLSCSTASGFDLAEFANVVCRVNEASALISVFNNYCTPVSPVVTMSFSPKYSYVSAVPLPASVVGNTITWNVSTLAANTSGPALLYAAFSSPTGPRVPGDTVHSFYSAMPVTGDVDTTNNIDTLNSIIRGAYDPNDIAVSPAGYIPSGTWLSYTVRFENTGNDTAHNIHVMDTLSGNLDISTMEIVGASARMDIAISKEGGQNIFKFDFPNINLLDSSYHGLCDGIFSFRMKVKDGLPDGTLIPHQVGIYFDDNAVVMTNNAQDTIGIPLPPPLQSVYYVNAGAEVYPNPAKDLLTISAAEGAYSTLTIANYVGQALIQQAVTGAYTPVSIKNLPAGVYIITLRGNSGTLVKKFVKE
jgi:hypothetical protein